MFDVIEVGGAKSVTTKQACNHVYVVDVSYSMYGSLEKVREHLRNNVSMVAKEDDTVSVIWFSGRGQCGVVFENTPIHDLQSLQAVHTAIDRYLKPVGATAFADPLELAMKLNLSGDRVNNFIMMTDGYNNSSSESDIFANLDKLSDRYHSIAFIEYGYYADREMLAKMAEASGGIHIFADGFSEYEKAVESAISNVSRVNNIEVFTNKAAKNAIYTYGDQIRIVDVKEGIAIVPEDVDVVYSIVPKDVLSKKLSADRLYLIMYYARKTNKDELVWNCLQRLGDVRLIDMYQNALSKQELSEFDEAVRGAVFDESLRFMEGRDLNAVPNKNAYTVMQLLSDLSADEDATLVVDAPEWNYERTGRARVALNELPKFEQSPLSKLSLKGLVLNSSRPNVSLQTTIAGVIKLPENEYGLDNVPSFITRNYTIVRDGIKNMKKLPVTISVELHEKLMQNGVKMDDKLSDGKSVYTVIDIGRMPVVNRGQVENVSLEQMAAIVGNLTAYKVEQKVIRYLLDQFEGAKAKSAGMAEKYGDEAAQWLSSLGIRDYGYSAVGTTSAEATDEYQSIEVTSKIKGFSTIPAIHTVVKKADEINGGNTKKKLNDVESLVFEMYSYHKDRTRENLEGMLANVVAGKRYDETLLAGFVSALILGRKWFDGFDGEATTKCMVAGKETTVTFDKVRKMIAI